MRKRDKEGRFAKAGDNASPECEHMMVAYMTGVARGKDMVRAETVKTFPLHVLTNELRRRGMKVFDAEGAHVKPTLEQIRSDGWTDEEIRKAAFSVGHRVHRTPCVTTCLKIDGCVVQTDEIIPDQFIYFVEAVR